MHPLYLLDRCNRLSMYCWHSTMYDVYIMTVFIMPCKELLIVYYYN